MRVVLLIFVSLFLVVIPTWPQTYLTQTGVPTFTTSLPVELGFINLGNGSLHLQIQLGSFPERGREPFTAGLLYDSRIWSGATGTWQPTNAGNQGGWRFFTSASPGSVSAFGNRNECDTRTGQFTIYTFYWTDALGTQRTFPVGTEYDPTGCDSNNPTGDDFATDASGYHMYVVNYTQVSAIYAPDGTLVYPSVKDTNGNYFSTDGSGNFIDPTGRTPVTVISNCNGNSSQTCYNVLNSQGTRSTYTVTTTSLAITTAFGQPGITEFSNNFPVTVIQSIQLPDNTSYQFGYDSYGELNSITLPTAGQVTYGYTNFQDSFANKNRWVTSRISGGGTWSYTPAVITTCGTSCSQSVTVTKPSGDNAVYTFTMNSGAWATNIQFYTGAVSSANLIATDIKQWNFSSLGTQLQTDTLLLPQPAGSNIAKSVQYTYSGTNTMNLASIMEWKFFAGVRPSTPDRETDFTYLTTSAYTTKHILDRVLSKTVKVGSTVVQLTNFSYDDSGALTNSSPATGIQNHDDTNYGLGNNVRGNLTTIQRCINLSSCSTNPSNTTTIYDTTGQILSIKDSNGNTTSLGYADKFYNDVGDGPANPPQSHSVTTPTNAYLTTVTPPLLPPSTFGYFYGTGQPALATDANGQTSYEHFFDSYFSRPTSSVLPNGGWTYTAYNPSETQVDAYTGITGPFATSGCSGCRQDEVLLDNLGRVTTQKLISDPEGVDNVISNYDTGGRVLNTSHPYRTTSDPTYGLETPTYDGLNRIIKVTHQNGTHSQTLFGTAVTGAGVNTSQLCSSTSYGLGFPTLFIDEAGKKRETWVDGFGRTIEGDEPDANGNLTSATCYSYDALGNVLQIVHGSQTRTYAYDALSRVTSVKTPELANCAVTYSYDSNGNILTRTSPAPNQTSCSATVTTCFGNWSGTSCDGTGYDALNRPRKKTYSDGTTPTVQYGYDGAVLTGCGTTPPSLTDSNPKGRLTSMCDGSGATSWAHDLMGRIMTEKRTILGSTQTLSYSYNLDGSIATVNYPSGKTVTYTISNAQRLTAAKDVSNNIQFATAASYAAPGMLQGLVTGQISGFGGITESHNYNSSLEYASTKATSSAGTALDLTLNYNTSGSDNGSVIGVTNNVDNGRTQTLTYDPLNRILSAISSNGTVGNPDCWGQVFGPNGTTADDASGNFTNINSGTQTQPPCQFGMLTVSVDANNHISNSGYSYDAAGNMSQDGTGYAYTFDAENRLTLASGMSGGPYCYVYDGNGLRVAKKSAATSCSSGTVVKLYWRSLSGDALAETDGAGNTLNEYIFFTGRRVASRNGSGGTFYYFADQVGSVRSITTGSGPGQTPGQLCYDADFTPYGQEMSHTERLQTTACAPGYKFTGYERDSETGLDYAFARYYSSRLGRFLSTDPLGGSAGNLQSHNGYSYVLNNPVNFMDSLGLWCSAPVGQDYDTPCTPSNDPSLSGDPFGGYSPFDLMNIPVQTGTQYVFEASMNGYGDPFPFSQYSLDELMSMASQGEIDLISATPVYGSLLLSLPGGEGDLIGDTLKKLQKLLKSDPNCSSFLGGNGSDPQTELSGIIDNHLYGQTEMQPTSTGPGTLSMTNAVSGGYIPGQAITVNTIGAFYNSTYKNMPLTTDRGRIAGGTAGAQGFILLHELAHLTDVIKKDFHDQKAVDQNDKALEEHCKDLIKALSK